MNRFVAYALCTALMFGVYAVLRYIVYDAGNGFGDGFYAGAMTMIILFWAAERVQKARH